MFKMLRVTALRVMLLQISILFSTPIFAAEYNFIISNGKQYRVAKDAAGRPVLNETTFTILDLDNGNNPNPNPNPNPTPNPIPNPGPTDPFEKEVARLTQEALNQGATKTTAAGISSAYSLIADEVLSGKIPLDKALDSIKRATNLVLGLQPDKDKWTKWRTDMSTALQTLQQEGHFNTKEKCAAAFKSVAKGMDFVTGYNGNTKAPAQLIGKNEGIFGDIDIERLIEIIKFIVELIKLFTGVVS